MILAFLIIFKEIYQHQQQIYCLVIDIYFFSQSKGKSNVYSIGCYCLGDNLLIWLDSRMAFKGKTNIILSLFMIFFLLVFFSEYRKYDMCLYRNVCDAPSVRDKCWNLIVVQKSDSRCELFDLCSTTITSNVTRHY